MLGMIIHWKITSSRAGVLKKRQNKETNKHQLEEVQILFGKILWMDEFKPAGADDIYVCLFIGLQENKHLGCA